MTVKSSLYDRDKWNSQVAKHGYMIIPCPKSNLATKFEVNWTGVPELLNEKYFLLSPPQVAKNEISVRLHMGYPHTTFEVNRLRHSWVIVQEPIFKMWSPMAKLEQQCAKNMAVIIPRPQATWLPSLNSNESGVPELLNNKRPGIFLSSAAV